MLFATCHPRAQVTATSGPCRTQNLWGPRVAGLAGKVRAAVRLNGHGRAFSKLASGPFRVIVARTKRNSGFKTENEGMNFNEHGSKTQCLGSDGGGGY